MVTAAIVTADKPVKRRNLNVETGFIFSSSERALPGFSKNLRGRRKVAQNRSE
jgi:hypothetical protein